jgi:hypothetical protein
MRLGSDSGAAPLARGACPTNTGDNTAATEIGSMTDQGTYVDTGDDSLQAMGDDGSLLTLDDGSIWAVNDLTDQSTVSYWTDLDSMSCATTETAPTPSQTLTTNPQRTPTPSATSKGSRESPAIQILSLNATSHPGTQRQPTKARFRSTC